jgi:hypothetical protein
LWYARVADSEGTASGILKNLYSSDIAGKVENGGDAIQKSKELVAK